MVPHQGSLRWLATMALVTAMVPVAGCKAPNLSLTRDTLAPVLVAPLRQPREAIPPDGRVTVRDGDNIYAIAARYGVPPTSIIRDNQIGPPYAVVVGQVLRLTPPRTHVVGPEDSIYSLSQRYAVSQYQLAEANGVEAPFTLEVGQRLILPDQLDFSVLDVAPQATTVAAAVPPPPVPAATPAVRKRFVAPSGTGAFRWPIEGEIVTEFGPAARGVHNDGVNIAAAAGTDVRAAARGTVAFVGREIKSFGTLILVKHDGGIITAYAHLGEVLVREGDVIEIGQKIATVGQTGKVDSPQLHFEIRRSRKPIDPRTLIA
ncbi:MAG: M23 family metallopeptidase [SAR116 cluster bacterium]|nr:MAG: M23 family metallopeptidase [SAR116 cluster bacterium]